MNVRRREWVIDADTHFLETVDLWNYYMDPSFRYTRPALRHSEGRLTFVVDGCSYPPNPGHQGLGSLYRPDGTAVGGLAAVQAESLDPAARLGRMGRAGVGAEVVYPTLAMMGASSIRDSPTAGAHCRAYNRFAAERSVSASPTLLGAMVVPVNHPEAAAEELRFARANLGLGVLYASFSSFPAALATGAHDELWAAAQDLDVTVTFQESTLSCAALPPEAPGHRSWHMLYLHAHTLAVQSGLADLLLGGVLERFPALRIGLQETHVGWIAPWLRLLDEHMARSRSLPLKPSDYFRRQCFVAASPTEPDLREFIDFVGVENLLFGSDWPHSELDPGRPADWVHSVRNRADLAGTTAETFLTGNPIRWFPELGSVSAAPPPPPGPDSSARQWEGT